MTPELERLLSVPVEDDLDRRPVDELRTQRRRMEAWETAVSLTRRLTQGRLDMLQYEVRRRAGASEEGSGNDLLFDLPDILADNHSGTTRRALALQTSGECADALTRLLDDIAPRDLVCRTDTLADDQLGSLIADLTTFEQQLSDVRHGLHGRLDTLHDEIGRRYRDGEVSVDSVLR